MKKISSAILAIVMSFYGVLAMTPTLVSADNGSDNGNGNKSNQEIKHSFSWGAFASSIRSNSEKFGSFINKNIHRNNNGNKNKSENNNENEHHATSTPPTATTTPDTTAPNILFASNIGLSTSTTSVIWVTNEASNSKIWFGTTGPVATTTSPMNSSGTLSYFHNLGLPGLATSTLYYYTISSTDSSGNTGYYSTSFTTPAI